ncbi:tetrahydromethanopterin S-methyltransferase subunit F [Sinorhizobium kostiense]|uniref:Tetrahydromethanopterin S-methyltransferase subunit F n=1 Tax=Sinorhizobium kostiense TaxID=76747 RepID=A0ABS4R505_9HYPH|nr:tetrahydromethanopterin S-methyltransferase subunit F [Sinorhizobium kostiense]
MSLRKDLRVFREPGFYISAVFAVVFLGVLLVFGGLAVS